MNVKRVLAITLATLLVTLAFAGAASAFSVKQEAKSSPSGALVPGWDVSSNMKILIYDGEMSVSDSLVLRTDLVGQTWTVDVYNGGTRITTLNPSYVTGYAISGFDLVGYGADIELVISVEGTVSSESAGSSISTIMLSESGSAGGTTRTYSAPSQKVYDTGNLAGNLQTLIDGINSVETSINEYVAAGYDCSQAKSYLESARSKYNAAVAAGTNEGVTAFTNYEEGAAVLEKAKQSLAYVSLSMILTYTSQIDDIITQLYSKGWNTEGKLVDTKNTKIKSTYDTCLKEYQAGNTDMTQLTALRVEVVDLYNEALGYLEESQKNPLENIVASGIIAWILIGVGVIVAIIVAIILIRRRKGSWDELG